MVPGLENWTSPPVAGRFVSRDPLGLWGDEAGCSLIFTELTPNSFSPDRLYPNRVLCDPDNPVTNNASLNLPCVHGDGTTTDTAASRSRHPGGVYVLLVDGSVRFVADAVQIGAWRQMGGIADGNAQAAF